MPLTPRQTLLTNSMITLGAQDALTECLWGLLPSQGSWHLSGAHRQELGHLHLLLSSTLMGHLLAELTVGSYGQSFCRRLGGRAFPATPLCSLPGGTPSPLKPASGWRLS